MKLCMFPYTQDAKTILRHIDMFTGNTIASVSSFKEDIKLLNALATESNLNCNVDIKEAMKNCDALLLLDNTQDFLLTAYYEAYHCALTTGKDVFMSRCLFEEMLGEAEEVNHVKILGYPGRQHCMNYLPRLLDIETPIIIVVGAGENCNKFESQLMLKKVFDKRGFNNIYMSSNDLGLLFGMDSLPGFLFRNDFSFPKKVMQFNHYVYKICKDKNPDVMVIGVPGGITSLAEYNTNYFSEMPLIISNALKVDSSIFCFYFTDNLEKMNFKEAANQINQKFSFPIDLFSMGRQIAEYNPIFKRADYLFLDDDFTKRCCIDMISVPWLILPILLEDSYRKIDTYITELENGIHYI